jgi:hypothetical protein
MVFKPVEARKKRRRRIDGHNLLPKIIEAAKFASGAEVVAASAALRPDSTADPSGRRREPAIARPS